MKLDVFKVNYQLNKSLTTFIIMVLLTSCFTYLYAPKAKADTYGTFGYTEKGATSDHNANWMGGSNFTLSETFVRVDNITVYVERDGYGASYMKCAIYNQTDYSLVAASEQWQTTTDYNDWKTFDLPDDTYLTAGTYLLMVWCDSNQFIAYCAYGGGYTNAGFSKTVTYDGNFPSTFSGFGTEQKKWSIYANYTIVEEEPLNTQIDIKGKWVNSSIPNSGFSIDVLTKSNVTLSHYIIGDNSTSTFTNSSQINFTLNQYSAMARKTGTLPSNGSVLAWQAWIWDTTGNMTTTGLQTMKVYSISLSYTNVTTRSIQSAVDACNTAGGGSVVVPAGTYTFNMTDYHKGTWADSQYRGVIVYGGVNIIGAGDNQTILDCPTTAWQSTAGGAYADVMFYLDGTNGKGIRISGLYLNGSIDYTDASGTGGENSRLIGIAEDAVTDFRVDHCTFINFNNIALLMSRPYVNNMDGNRGIVDHCLFDNPYKEDFLDITGVTPIWGYGIVAAGGYGKYTWSNDYSSFFGNYQHDIQIVEDCRFTRCRHMTSGGSESFAYYVLRYSWMSDMIVAGYGSYVDIHGGGQGIECYNVTIVNTAVDHRSYTNPGYWGDYVGIGIYLRGGAGLIYNNTIHNIDTGETGKAAIVLANDQSNATLRLNHVWVWDNNFVNITGDGEEFGTVPNDFSIDENDEYFLRAPTSGSDGFTYRPLVYPIFLEQEFEDLTDTPTPTDSPAKETASNLLNALLLWGVVPFAVIASVIVVAVKKGLVDRKNVDPRVIVAGVSVALFVPFVVMLTVVIVEMIANAF